jgi:HSP20 family molecular chaperone IbpA
MLSLSKEFREAFMPMFNSIMEVLPLCNVNTDGDNVIMEHVLPGFNKSGFAVELVTGKKIKVSYKKEKDSTNKWDFDFSKVYSTVYTIDPESVRASYANGIFTVSFSSIEERQADRKLIEVK